MAFEKCSDEIQDCDLKNLSDSMLFRKLLRETAGCFSLNVSGISGGGGSGGDASASNQVLEIAAINKLVSESTDSLLDKRFPSSGLLTNAAQVVKAGAGNVMGWNFINTNTVPVYIKFFSGAPVLGTTIPVLTIMVPPGNGSVPGYNYQDNSSIQHIFAGAINVIATTDISDLLFAAPTNGLLGNIKYK